ncbi:MAG TPA: DedA family protein [Bacteroidota bacterium]|nr:DedA family protein [Bacteroidota bacterium]
MEIITQWISHYGYFGLFSLLMLGIVGLPVPDETLLTFAGYLIFKKQLSFPLTLLFAFLGSSTGISLSYALGRSLGLFLIHKYGRYVFITPEKLELVHRWFLRRGRWSLPIGYFIPGVRHLTAYVAGASRLEIPVFAAFAYAGALVWSATFILLGYFLGDQWEFVLSRLQDNIFEGTLIVLAILALIWILRKKLIRLK